MWLFAVPAHSDVSLYFNCDLPNDAENYVAPHRPSPRCACAKATPSASASRNIAISPCHIERYIGPSDSARSPCKTVDLAALTAPAAAVCVDRAPLSGQSRARRSGGSRSLRSQGRSGCGAAFSAEAAASCGGRRLDPLITRVTTVHLVAGRDLLETHRDGDHRLSIRVAAAVRRSA